MVKLDFIGRASVIALSLGMASPAFAQDAASEPQAEDAGGISDIVVTAQRREQNAQDIGVSVVALGSEDLQRLGVRDSMDIMKVVPGVMMQNTFGGGGTNANLSIRGISQTDTSPNQEPPNAIYFDEVFLSSPAMASFGLYDLERIEVLRGPQGTLFGRASSGGLASFVPAKPSTDWNGYVEAGYASFNNVWAEAAVGGPLSDRVRVRISGRLERSDGWLINTLPGGTDAFENNTNGIRAQLEADISDRLTARIAVSYDQTPKGPMGGYKSPAAYLVNGLPKLMPANVDGWGTGVPGSDMFGYVDKDPRFNRAAFNSFGTLTKDRFAPTLYLTYDLGGATLSSITNFTRFNFDYSEDADGLPLRVSEFFYGQDLDQLSQELRINGESGGLVYTAGAYLLKADQSVPQRFSGYYGTPGEFEVSNIAEQDLDSYAVFGQFEYESTPQLKLTAGGRYTREIKSIDSKAYIDNYGGTAFVPPLAVYDFSSGNPAVGSQARIPQNLLSGKLQLDYKPSDYSLIYIGVSRGVKGAGFNTNLAANSTPEYVTRTPFKSEYVYAYEGGAKFDLFDRKVRINASAFYYDYHRFQGYTFISVAGLAGNYDGYFKGGELDVTLRPMQDLDINLGAAYLKTKLKDVTGTYYVGPRDREAAQAPEWTLTGSVTKSFPLPIGKLAFTWDGNYIDNRWGSIDNNPASFVSSSFVHNANATLFLDKSGIQLQFFVRNISNTARMTFSTDTTSYFGNWHRIYAQPRWIGGSIRKTF